MISEDRIQDTVRVGEKNRQTAELVQNWCAHARISRMGGRGMIEEIYGVPIGHMGVECDHAPAGGMMCWDLADAAIQFYDANCAGCTQRQPVSLPNLTQLLAERDSRRRLKQQEDERYELEKAQGLARRVAQRAVLRPALDPVAATNLDLLDELDRTGDAAIGDKLVEVAGLAPETFPAPLVAHLFDCLDIKVFGLMEPALRILARLPDIDRGRLVDAALLSLARFGEAGAAAKIVEAHATHASPDHIGPALKMLLSMATYDHEPLSHERTLVQEPLLRLYQAWPVAVRDGVKAILGSTEAWDVGLGARGLRVLLDYDANLAGFMTDDLLAKLARAKWLVQGDEHGVDSTLHDLRRVLVAAFDAAPEAVDTAIQQYLAGASPQGINELYLLYRDVLHRVLRHDEKAPLTQAHRIALRRLVEAATKYGLDDNGDRFTATMDMMHGEPRELTPIVAQEIDNLLGSAAILYVKLEEALARPRDPSDPMTFWTRMGLRQRLGHTADIFIKWACKAAGDTGPVAITKVLSFLEGVPEGDDRLRGEIVANFDALADTAEGLKLCLPQYYSAMVGPSQLARSCAATALGEMSRQAHENMPSLVFEAFVALMGDPYVIVHRAAVRALERFSLPKALDADAGRALGDIIMHYAKARPDDRFLVTAIELFAHRYAKRERLAGRLGETLLDILMQIEPQLLMQEARNGLPVLGDHPKYVQFFLRLLASPDNHEHDVENLLDYLERHPPNNLYDEREALADAGVKIARHWLFELPPVIEALTACGAWAEAANMVRRVLDGIEDNRHFKSRRLHLQLYRIACEVEAALAAGEPSKLDELTEEWAARLAEEENINAEIEQKNPPFPRILSAT